jgi:Zn finger protein HypA/HybF involved in hydrogenase expression
MPVSNMRTGTCVVCEGEFLAEKMVGEKCDSCHVRFPRIKNKKELEERREAEDNAFNAGSFESRVKALVEGKLQDYGILIKCECGNSFYKKSPAQKKCGKCGDKK